MKLFITAIMAAFVALCCLVFAMSGISLSMTLRGMGIAPGELFIIGSALLSIGFIRRHMHRLQPLS
jgi:ABC-type transport system involved in multi-copper enzyme maturation permease subunit